MNVAQYVEKINLRLAQGHTSEHTFRADLEQLLATLLPDCNIINEPSKITDCGNPDFVVTRKGVPLGYIEAKDIGKDLNHKGYKEQFTRYKKALDNLIITDYVQFQFFVQGEMVAKISLGDLDNNRIDINHNDITLFENRIREFSTNVTQVIKSPGKLAELMAGKARLLENILQGALQEDLDSETESELTNQFNIFRDMLIQDLESKQFADLYAQTLAYGMFAARYHDPTLDTFDRDEAARLIPKSNPLLRNLFQSIAGHNIDKRIATTVDNLAEVFSHADVRAILHGYGKSTAKTDPIIHFYETFLAKYDPALRKSRGVWYTPEPVVSFIVRAVDEILKSKFNLTDGLADTSKTKIELQSQVRDNRTKSGWRTYEKEVHRVQILDPATGTGTFLAEVVKYLYQERFQDMTGVWPSYVEEHLIPRLNGFELLMASYAMAHLKLDMLLGETGYTIERRKMSDNRLRIFLTNSLEEYHPDTHTLFSQWLSNESREANAVKKDTPVMVVMGNPPYSGISSNNGKWIADLIDDYKVEPGGKQKLQERKHWLNDDYVKFMRFAQYLIEKNGEGVMAFINPHGFLDNPTFRGMRWKLLSTYDEIYVLDLHGNAKKKETGPDGSKDENVFDIEQGVSINIFVKNGSCNRQPGDLGQIYHYDLYGKRAEKYAFLEKTAFNEVPYKLLPNVEPMYFMVPKDFEAQNQFLDATFSVNSMFLINSTGMVTARDKIVIDFNDDNVLSRIEDITNSEIPLETLRQNLFPNKKSSKYLPGDSRGWKLSDARASLQGIHHKDQIKTFSYRPFDDRVVYYHPKMVDWDRSAVMKNMLLGQNHALLITKAHRDQSYNHAFVTDKISEAIFLSGTTGSNSIHNPLYLYPEDGGERVPNLNCDEIKIFETALGLNFAAENENKSFVPSCIGGEQNQFTPIDILDYIYAVLHSPTYRDTYQEFLKTDFPRIPYPNPETFWELVKLGDEIRLLHLMKSPLVDSPITQYPVGGDNKITRKITENSPGYEATSDTYGKVWINDTQYFDKVPHRAWLLYIGGYQPAQKWLKDRKGRELSFDDIRHYQRVILALTKTEDLMAKVDKILYEDIEKNS